MTVTKEQLQKLFSDSGDGHFNYLKNKHRGGTSNSKGNTYENQFAVYKIAEAFNSKENPEHILFSSQVFCFIDDLVIEKTSQDGVEHYQIKDIVSLTWKDRLSDDFKMQYKVCLDNGTKPTLELVVSRNGLKKQLDDEMDDDLRKIASVFHFSAATSINNLIRTNEAFRHELISMCGLHSPTTDKLDALGTVVLGTWAGMEQNKVPLRNIIDKCRSINSNYIRGHENDISAELKELFANIAGFAYRIEGGYIEWTYKDTDKGTVSFLIGTNNFAAWENELLKAESIKSFEDLETRLI